ncbi:hypothetical protein NIES2119_17120 [[Phormidium ambiguum] IAM M-71]|uniref:Uncharacterized protein n=1 Tax=[Phormidium ambiguum] IAM M-71 TaxID=454136 RepID=A0A1U7IH37_9CYAN|nr:DUF3598 family protein [Phormidium ambiguum]OKH36368.1 hypothetical protein NIES2119_17120 [Phormidium ambiguum IAM M-71]
MKSQWECLLENLGEWRGSFTRFSPAIELLADTPTIVSLEGLNNNQAIRQKIQKFSSTGEVSEQVLEYSSLGRSVLFFENGAFSQGSIQIAPFSEFGAELGLIDGNLRLRLVQLFNKNSELESITLIRETLASSQPREIPDLTVEQLLGEWVGEAVTIYPDWRSPDTYPTHLKIYRNESGELVQQLSFANRNIESIAKIQGSILCFEQSPQRVQVLLLPNGASASCPAKISFGQNFFLEVGWLYLPNQRQRLIRSYNEKGEWVSLTLVKEKRVQA